MCHYTDSATGRLQRHLHSSIYRNVDTSTGLHHWRNLPVYRQKVRDHIFKGLSTHARTGLTAILQVNTHNFISPRSPRADMVLRFINLSGRINKLSGQINKSSGRFINLSGQCINVLIRLDRLINRSTMSARGLRTKRLQQPCETINMKLYLIKINRF